MKNEINNLLKENDYSTILLDKSASKGRTIIEKFQDYAGESTIAIIIMSGDDRMKNGKLLPRQNVIFEMGYFMALIGRDKVILVKNKNVSELPSDVSGIVYIEYSKGSQSWRENLMHELNELIK